MMAEKTTLGHKIELAIFHLQEGNIDGVTVCFTSSEDQHKNIYESIENQPYYLMLKGLRLYLEEFNKYGKAEGVDQKGYVIRIVDIKYKEM